VSNVAESYSVRPINSFPEWQEASAKMRDFADRYNVAAGKLQAFRRPAQGHRSIEDDCADGATEQQLARAADDLREAVVHQKEILDEIEGRCAYEIVEEAEPNYQAMLWRILESASDLCEALDEESDFRRMLTSQRVATGTMPAIPRQIRRAISSLRAIPEPFPGCLTAFVSQRRGGGAQSLGEGA
jgi:hypothetical protein